jgi:3,5-epimerase/4-reductase
MHWLLFGAKGWIGKQVYTYLIEKGEQVTPITENIETPNDVKQIFNSTLGVDRVFIAIGRAYLPEHRRPENYQAGGLTGTIDDLEHPAALPLNLRDNIFLPMIIAEECVQRGIHCTYLGTGCIYEFDEDHPKNGKGFREMDQPNYTGSSYSTAKTVTDQWFSHYRQDKVLNLRIRMPITATWNPRNFLYKILKYQTIVSIPNSMTILPDLIPLALQCAESKITGTLNLVNPGPMNHKEILELIAKKWNIQLKCVFTEDPEQIQSIVRARRSNNHLEAHRLMSLFPGKVNQLSEGLQELLNRWKPTEDQLKELGYSCS